MAGQLVLGAAAPARESGGGGCGQTAGPAASQMLGDSPRINAALSRAEGPADADEPSSGGSAAAAASSSGAGPGQSGYSAVAGTVAELIAGGEQQEAVCCVRAAFNFGQASKQGWMVLCNTHALQQQQRQETQSFPGSFAAPPVVLTALPTPSPLIQPPVKTTSISARWRQQIQKKKKKRPGRTGAAASGGASTTEDFE